MENIAPFFENLATLRNAVGDSVVRAYGAEKRYAEALNALFEGFAWYDIEASDVNPEAKPVHAEKKELFKVLKDANHTNPSTVWARVRKIAKGLAEPAVKGEGEGEGEGEGKGAGSRGRDPMLRNVEDLVILYKFNARQDSLPVKVFEAQKHIIEALQALGVDLNLIK